MNGLVVVNIMLIGSFAIMRDHSDRHLYNFVQLRREKCPVDSNYDFYKTSMGVFKGCLLWCIIQSFNAVSGGIIKNQTKEENNHNQWQL